MTPWPLAGAVAALRDAIAAGLAASGAGAVALTVGPYTGDAAADGINLWPWAVTEDAARRTDRPAVSLRLTMLVTCHAAAPERALVLAGTVMAALAARPVTPAAEIIAAPVPEALLPLLARRPAPAPPLCYELRFTAPRSVGDLPAQDVAAIFQP